MIEAVSAVKVGKHRRAEEVAAGRVRPTLFKQIKYSKCVVLILQLNSALDPISSGRQLRYHSIFMRTETARRGVPRKEPFKIILVTRFPP